MLEGDMLVRSDINNYGIIQRTVNEMDIDDRPSIDEVMLEVTRSLARRSTCRRRHMGALMTTPEGFILASGYNGAPSGAPHCTDIGCARDNIESGTRHELCRAVHAEQNAIVQAAKHGISLKGATCYCTNQPCIICAKLMVNLGIARVVYLYDYPDKKGIDALLDAGVEVVRFIK